MSSSKFGVNFMSENTQQSHLFDSASSRNVITWQGNVPPQNASSVCVQRDPIKPHASQQSDSNILNWNKATQEPASRQSRKQNPSLHSNIFNHQAPTQQKSTYTYKNRSVTDSITAHDYEAHDFRPHSPKKQVEKFELGPRLSQTKDRPNPIAWGNNS